MPLDFFRGYGGQRMVEYDAQEPLLDAPDDEDDMPAGVKLDDEMAPDEWKAQPVVVPNGWRANEWSERPVRFVDGKDSGETVTWLRAPNGYPVPVRLSEIGAT